MIDGGDEQSRGAEPRREIDDLHKMFESMVLDLRGMSCRCAVAIVYYTAQRSCVSWSNSQKRYLQCLNFISMKQCG